MKKTFSVVLPVYLHQTEHQVDIQACLDSITKNSSPFELIVVDDASPLNTSFLQQKADIFIHHDVNKGVASSWNSGIKRASGRYIVIINDDIVVPQGWLEGLKEVINGGCDAVGPAVEHLPNDPVAPTYQWFPGSCFMLNRACLDKVGLFDESFNPFFFEDTDYWTRLLKKGLSMGRNFNIFVQHQEGQTVKTLARDEIYQKNLKMFMAKHGFNPIPFFCGGALLPFAYA